MFLYAVYLQKVGSQTEIPRQYFLLKKLFLYFRFPNFFPSPLIQDFCSTSQVRLLQNEDSLKNFCILSSLQGNSFLRQSLSWCICPYIKPKMRFWQRSDVNNVAFGVTSQICLSHSVTVPRPQSLCILVSHNLLSFYSAFSLED